MTIQAIIGKDNRKLEKLSYSKIHILEYFIYSHESDDFDNDDIQGLRRRSKSCGQIPRVCPTPRQVSDQSSSMSHVVTNSQKSFQTVDNKSLKSAKLMRKEKTVLLLKKNRTVFAEREEPDFDSMNSFGPRGGKYYIYIFLNIYGI